MGAAGFVRVGACGSGSGCGAAEPHGRGLCSRAGASPPPPPGDPRSGIPSAAPGLWERSGRRWGVACRGRGRGRPWTWVRTSFICNAQPVRGHGSCGRVACCSHQQLLWALRCLHPQKCGAPSPPPPSLRAGCFTKPPVTSAETCRCRARVPPPAQTIGGLSLKPVRGIEPCASRVPLQTAGGSRSGLSLHNERGVRLLAGEGDGDLTGGATIKPGDSLHNASRRPGEPQTPALQEPGPSCPHFVSSALWPRGWERGRVLESDACLCTPCLWSLICKTGAPIIVASKGGDEDSSNQKL